MAVTIICRLWLTTILQRNRRSAQTKVTDWRKRVALRKMLSRSSIVVRIWPSLTLTNNRRMQGKWQSRLRGMLNSLGVGSLSRQAVETNLRAVRKLPCPPCRKVEMLVTHIWSQWIRKSVQKRKRIRLRKSYILSKGGSRTGAGRTQPVGRITMAAFLIHLWQQKKRRLHKFRNRTKRSNKSTQSWYRHLKRRRRSLEKFSTA